MARKVCTAGVVGSISFIVLNQQGEAVSAIRDDDGDEIITRHVDIDNATQWMERKVIELIGKKYEDD